MEYKVLITTSGTGSRLKELTKDTNKVLVPLAGKPVLHHLFASYPTDTRFVLTVGYNGDLVMQEIQQHFADRNVEFVHIDTYEGPGSSLGYSMLRAKPQLQCPFIFHACDTIVQEPVPMPDKNWCGGQAGPSTEQYSSFRVLGDRISAIQGKKAPQFDFLHIGLVGIHDFQKFWNELQKAYDANPDDSALNDVVAINEMINAGVPFSAVDFPSWLDIGNVESWREANERLA